VAVTERIQVSAGRVDRKGEGHNKESLTIRALFIIFGGFVGYASETRVSLAARSSTGDRCVGDKPSRARTGCDVAVETNTSDPRLPVIGQGGLAKVRKSRHARWRAVVLGAVHLLIVAHAIHFLVAGRTLSPVEPSESMYTLELGHVNAGFIFFAVALLSTLILGRWVCGWACHLIAIQDLCGWIMKKLGVRPRPFRSRLLRFAPWLVALYMFVWPSALRWLAPRIEAVDWGPLSGPAAWLTAGAPGPFPGFSNHLMTTGFWDTFAGPVFASLTFLTCGFAIVYLLGAKGFCTYGCPYGAFFGGLDRFAPGRIVVNDDCEQCGHCTATCTSNVRVHEEVRLYGTVVDSGCMKCTDCVSVCPKNALRYGFAKPAIFKGAPAGKPSRRYDLSLTEEILVFVVFFVTTWWIFRGLYDSVPLLMSVGLGGITGFAALQLGYLVKRPGVRIQNLTLKSGGKMRTAGWIFAAVALAWMVFAAHSAFVQWHRARGAHHLNLTQASREDVLSGAFRSKTYRLEHQVAAEESFRHFRLADRFGIYGVAEVKLGLAWGHLLRGEPAEAESAIRAAIALAPDNPARHHNLYELLLAQRRLTEAAEVLATKIEVSRDPTAGDHFDLAGLLALGGRYDDALPHYLACIELAPEFGPARYNAGGILRRKGRFDEAVAQLQAARETMPEDPDVHVELGLALASQGRAEEAAASLGTALELDPAHPGARAGLERLREPEGTSDRQ
jgi:tetratricopeptide (TPR) repeat protein/polyferredoxin